MKKLLLSFVFLIVIQFINAQNESASIKLPIAYVNIDTLLLNYQFARDANESLIKKQEEYRLTINTRARKLQTEMNEFQRKLEKNEFLSRELAEQEQTRLQNVQKELQDLDGKFSDQLKQEQNKLSRVLRDKIKLFIIEFNKDKKYEIIFSNTSSDNILFAAYGYDITDIVVKALNESYNREQNN
jgi:outer membrane protein